MASTSLSNQSNPTEELERLRSRVKDLEIRHQRVQAMLYGLGDAMIATDANGNICQMNRIAETLTGWQESEVLGKPVGQIFRIIHEQTRMPIENPVELVFQTKQIIDLENHALLISKTGKQIPIADSAAPIFDYQGKITSAVLIFRDQTRQRRNRQLMETRLSLIEFAMDHSLDELLTKALDEVGHLVDSPIGFYHFYDANTQTITLQQWSTRTLNEFCKIDEKGIQYSLNQAGVWGECIHEKKPIVHNDYPSLPHKKGLPPGHAEVIRELVVPVLRNNQVVAILGVGNKPTEYDAQDIEIVTYIADVTWEIIRQKRVEDHLATMASQWQRTFDATNDVIWILDPHHRILRANAATERLLGIKTDQIIGKYCWQVVHGTSQPIAECPILRVKKTFRRETMELESQGKWFQITVDPIADPVKGISSAVHIIRDITKQKQAENRLRKNEAKMRSIFSSAPVGIGLSRNRMILEVNERFCQITGYSQQELIGKSARLIYPTDEDYEFVEREKYRQIELYGTGTVETRFQRKDGTIIDVLLSSAPIDPSDLSAGVTFCVLDITDRKRATKALRESEENYRRIFENSIAGFYQSTPDGRFISVNQAFANILGYTDPSQMISEITDIENQYYDNPKDRQWFLKQMEEKGKIENYEFKVKCRNGSRKWVFNSSRAVRDNGGNIAYYEGVVIDISAQKAAELENKALEEQLFQARKMDSIGRLAGGVAHDLNNLLSPILGYSEMLRDDPANSDPAMKNALNAIFKAGMRARDLVQRLLTFSRKQPMEVKPLNLNRLITDFERLLRSSIREDISIELNLNPYLPTIQADAGQLEQVIMNLAINAQDAMPDGGKLTIATTRIDAENSRIGQMRQESQADVVMLTLTDTGSGIAPEIRQYLFEPFFTTKEKGKGTGLGLAIVHGIIKQHGGHIWVESTPGKGATFFICLPVAPASQLIEKKTETTVTRLGGLETILVVEDDEQVRILIDAMLKQLGYNVLIATNGNQALDILQSHKAPIHMLLTDVVMPGMSGYELFQQISGRYPQIRVLYMSGYPEDIIEARGVNEGGVPIIQKPFTINALAEKIRNLLDAPE